MKRACLLVFILIFCACQPDPQANSTATAMPAASATPTETTATTLTATPSPTDTPPAPTATTTSFNVCVPLEEETIESLPLILVNPLVIPPIGKDDGHHGVDFAYYRRGERESIEGIEIYAVLEGKAVVSLEDAIPYGYALIIETPLSQLPEDLQSILLTGYMPIPEQVVYQGVCPDFPTPENNGEMSVYHLYAHMQERSVFSAGDTIKCGALLGTVGNTGYSSNPHLHLETRLGPAGAEFSSMAFYEPVYSVEQRANYCLWRMSGHYQLFDPFLILNAGN